jgi:cAMP-dependent protein kinase regulator
MYEDFFKSVELLKSMDHYERSKLANVIKEQTFQIGETIIREVKSLLLINLTLG